MTFTLVLRVLLFYWKLKSKGASHTSVLRNDHFIIIWKTNLFKRPLHQYSVLRVFKLLVACVAAGPRTRLNPLYRRFRASATQASYLKLHGKNFSHLAMDINLKNSHTEDSKGYAITNCANRCSSKKGQRKILCSRMLTWPIVNCDSKNCVNILGHLQVDNMIIF